MRLQNLSGVYFTAIRTDTRERKVCEEHSNNSSPGRQRHQGQAVVATIPRQPLPWQLLHPTATAGVESKPNVRRSTLRTFWVERGIQRMPVGWASRSWVTPRQSQDASLIPVVLRRVPGSTDGNL